MVRRRKHVNTCWVLTPSVTTASVLPVNSKPQGFGPDDGRTTVTTYQTHWVEGRGLPGTPKGAPRVTSGTREETGEVVTRLRVLWERGLAHSISVFDVTGGSRFNVTTSFVTFDSRPRPVGAETVALHMGTIKDRFMRATA
jgi:hypothetical protein